MIGDIVNLKPHHFPPALKIYEIVSDDLQKSEEVFAFTIAGESGSGKSTLSLAIEKVLEEEGLESFIFHMDDYFQLPPKDNHDQRVSDIDKVGPQEVNLELLQKHIDQAKQGVDFLKKPLVHYRENRIREVIVELENIDVVIAEGTYATLLQNIDCKVFMERTFMDTFQSRKERGRDPIIPFTERVLEIEHEILKDHRKMADILVDKQYNVRIQQSDQPNFE